MEYLSSIIWLCLWPIVIYSSYRIVLINLKKFNTKKQG